jgi:diguanylate cyclase (GGDEF)-like protein/PAS domain S-box-containing protein
MTIFDSTIDVPNQLKLLKTCVSDMDQIVIITNNPKKAGERLHIIYVNNAFIQITGYAEHEVLGKSPAMLQGPKTDPNELIKINQAIKSEKGINSELLNYSKNGKEYWIALHLIPASIDAQSCTHFIGLSDPINDKKKALKTASEHKENLAFVLEVAGLGYWDLDVEKNQTTRSLKHDQIFGHTEFQKTWTYETFISHVYQDDQDRVDTVFKQAMMAGSHYDVEFRCQWPDNSMHWLWSKGRFVTNDKNEVIRAEGIQVDITAKKTAEAEIQKLAFTDQLTQLPNRTVFKEHLEAAIAISARKNIFGALLFLDLDDFKLINDTLGHHIGDQLLVAIAERLQQKLRNVDTIARFGGDEFVMILDDLGPSIFEARKKLEHIHQKLIAVFDQPFYCDGNEIHSRASIGTTIFNGDSASEHELLQQADLAMYFSKSSGKNTVHFFNDEMKIDLLNRANIEKDLRKAIKNDEFYLVYQPKVDHQNKSLGLEALIRWKHPVKGILLPQYFIAVAEDTGLIIPIGQWVLEQACLFLNQWSDLKIPSICSLSVNISPLQFAHNQFAELVIAALDAVPDSAGRLMLEITENALIEHLTDSILKINQLVEYGVSFSLDDFGTGYSSLFYLKKLPIREIKIDQIFVKDLIIDDTNEAIVSAVILIADKLALQVIVEGVETKEQVELLKSLGANIFQGFYFSEPLSEIDAVNYMLAHL